MTVVHFKQQDHTHKNCGTKYIMKRKLVYTRSWNKAECGLVWLQLETFLLGDSNFSPLYACQWMTDCKSINVQIFRLEINFRWICKYGNLQMMRIKWINEDTLSLSIEFTWPIPTSPGLSSSYMRSFAWIQPVWVRNITKKCPHSAHMDQLLIAY